MELLGAESEAETRANGCGLGWQPESAIPNFLPDREALLSGLCKKREVASSEGLFGHGMTQDMLIDGNKSTPRGGHHRLSLLGWRSLHLGSFCY